MVKDAKLKASKKEIEKESDVCELCGNFSDDLREVNGELICEECEETSTEA